MEKQVDRLKNLTEISIDDANNILTSLADMVQPNNETSDDETMTILPSELEIAGTSLQLVVGLNPVSTAPLEGVQEFTKVVANVSSSMINPSYASAWTMTQKNPASPGSSGIVTSAEVLSREVSRRLLGNLNQTQRVTAQSDSVAFWMDVYENDNFREEVSPRSNKEYESFEESYSYYSYQSESSSHEEQNNGQEGEDNRNEERDNGNEDTSKPYIFPPPTSPGVSGTTRSPETSSTYTTRIPGRGGFLDDVITLPRRALGRKSAVINVRYKNIDHAMPTRKEENRLLAEQARVRLSVVNSAVITTSVIPPPPDVVFQEDPVIIVFRHWRAARGNITDEDNQPLNATSSPNRTEPIISKSEETLDCVYWEAQTEHNEGGAWSTKGCEVMSSNHTHTVCSCTHLTSFAVLLQIVDYEEENELSATHQRALSIISKVGCVLSFIGVTLMCAAFIKLKFHTENMKIHFNLGLAVGFADLVFLFEEVAESSRTGCVIVTVLLYYFNMAVLAWMLIEGVHLYSQVVVVFVSARRWVKRYMVVGWGVPLFILTVSMGILNVKLGTNGICWLSPSDNSIWAFAAPALVVILINTVILITVIKVIINIQPEKSNHAKVSKLRNAVKGSIFLFPLLGTTWIFGLLSLSQNTLLFQYVFATTNSLQGFFLFVFHCLCNSEVREDARRHRWFVTSSSTQGLGTRGQRNQPGVLSLNVANGLRRFRNSISFETPTPSTLSNQESETEDSKKAGKLGAILSFFPQMFSSKFPPTIMERREYEETKLTPTGTPASGGSPRSDTRDAEKNVPLPGMPVKNDKFITSLSQLSLPKEAQVKLNKLLADHISRTDADSPPDVGELGKDEEQKMKMSYDSGLNSIENESELEDEDGWMEGSKNVKED
nr:adhesion G protein-coupled receptor L3-like [Ciona intestinalis]|eukprot:XP_009862007.2 adhesion G protein-coupled receptor L3-like [Ciona intestinalis]